MRDVQIICCGPGAAGIHAWNWHGVDHDATVILAGVGGAISSDLRRGAACAVDSVIDERTGRRWTPTFVVPGLPRASIASADHVVSNASGKQSLHAKTGAGLVDLESAAFAARAEAIGCRWAIVRGISDAADDSLPDGIEHWIDAAGRIRLWTIVRHLLFNPSTLRILVRLRRSSVPAMDEVANHVARLAEERLMRLPGR